VAYQPFARVSDLAILGYEALLRWAHPVYGQITPSVFIPLAESEGFIVSIGEWVLCEACKKAAEWPRELTVAVNVSPIQFTRADLPTLVQAVVSESGIAPQRIELEITESAVIGDLDRAGRTFAGLREIGVAMVLDDFGSGYSSLEILKSLPFDKIKIDRSLLKDVGSKPEANAIISAILRLTHTLGLRVVAEGVETSQQLDVLRLERCDTFQGFLLGQPITNPFGGRA
jgi:EAL domain-containing protein (putative c-di-GMP-specific phosphodiesterase class I)